MRLRLAKKIESTLRESGRYSEAQHDAASRRMDKTKSNREANSMLRYLCETLGPAGRAELLKDRYPAAAFELFMEADEE